MLFTLGERTKAGDVVDLLLACHHRVREHVALARRLADPPVTTGEAIVAAAAQIRGYFERAFPLHALDEEIDIFPVLAGRDPHVDAALDELVGDHAMHDAFVAQLCEICARVEEDPHRLPGLAARLREVVIALENELLAHIGIEETTVFPLIARLPSREREEMATRMRRRRET